MDAGATSVVEFVISDQREPSKRYSLFYAGQPTVNPGSTEVLVRATGRRPIPGKGIAVIGADIEKGLFGRIHPVGKTILVDGHQFLVIGTMLRPAASFFGTARGNIYLCARY